MPKDAHYFVYSHNDLLANNILLEKGTGKIWFIDFEYLQKNLITFDIGNYFNESQYDYDVKESPYFGVEGGDVDLGIIEDFLKYYAVQYLCEDKSK